MMDVMVVVMEMVDMAVVLMMVRISEGGIGSPCGCGDEDAGGEAERVSGIDGNNEKRQQL